MRLAAEGYLVMLATQAVCCHIEGASNAALTADSDAARRSHNQREIFASTWRAWLEKKSTGRYASGGLAGLKWACTGDDTHVLGLSKAVYLHGPLGMNEPTRKALGLLTQEGGPVGLFVQGSWSSCRLRNLLHDLGLVAEIYGPYDEALTTQCALEYLYVVGGPIPKWRSPATTVVTVD